MACLKGTLMAPLPRTRTFALEQHCAHLGFVPQGGKGNPGNYVVGPVRAKIIQKGSKHTTTKLDLWETLS